MLLCRWTLVRNQGPNSVNTYIGFYSELQLFCIHKDLYSIYYRLLDSKSHTLTRLVYVVFATQKSQSFVWSGHILLGRQEEKKWEKGTEKKRSSLRKLVCSLDYL